MNDSSVINFTRSQALIHLINASTTYCVWPRNSGKTSAGIGFRVLHLSEVMPRAQVLLYSDTFERLNDVLVPGILGFLEHDAGIVEGEDYVKYKKPPEHWTRPFIPLDKFDKVVSFRSGFCLCLASQKVTGSANGFNVYAALVDETKFIKEEKINTELLPAVRGNIAGRRAFEHLPEYCSVWYFTDKWGHEIKWVMKKKKLMKPQEVEAVLTIQKEILRLEKESEQFTSSRTQYNYKHRIDFLTEKANEIRKRLVYYSDPQPYDNIMVAGEKYFRDRKRDLSALEFSVAIENNDPDTVPNVFYPSFSKGENCYYPIDQSDVNPLKPFLVALDYQWRITPLVAAQPGQLPGRFYTTLNIVAGIHTLHPNGGIKQTVNVFCDKYETHICKEIHFFFDHTAVGQNPVAKSFYETVIDAFRERGWSVNEQYLGRAPEHHDRYNKFIDFFNHREEMAVLINMAECEYLIKSIQQAGAYTVNKKTKKDKTKEKNLNYPAEEQTDYSEALDQLLWGVLELKMYNELSVVGTGIYTGH